MRGWGTLAEVSLFHFGEHSVIIYSSSENLNYRVLTTESQYLALSDFTKDSDKTVKRTMIL